MKPLNIFILGPSGSGKSTQAKFLAKEFDLTYLKSGEMLRAIARQNNTLGKKIKKIMSEQGKFVPCKIVIKIAKEELKKIPKNKGIVFDGFGRKLPEIKADERMLAKMRRKIDFVFLIEIGEKETLKRLSKRRVCKKCGTNFILGKTISEKIKKCPKCGGEIYQRKDDSPTKIKSRLKEYQKETLPVARYLKKKGILIKINGEQPIKKVYKDILENFKTGREILKKK